MGATVREGTILEAGIGVFNQRGEGRVHEAGVRSAVREGRAWFEAGVGGTVGERRAWLARLESRGSYGARRKLSIQI